VNFGQCVIIAELWQPEVARSGNWLSNFCVFLEKRLLTVKFSQFCSESFHRLTDRRCCVNISCNVADGKSEKSCVIYLTNKNKISAASQTVATARIAPKICHDQPLTMYTQCSRVHPNRFTFGGVIAERVTPFLAL